MQCTSSSFPGIFTPGSFAEYVKTSARSCVPIPDGLEPVDVAAFGCAGLTVYHAVKKAVIHAYPGSYAVILGAGGLGHLAIQLMRSLSQAELIVADRSELALSHVKEWGADHVVQMKADGSHVQAIRDLTGGVGARVVLDCIGEHGVQNQAVKMLGAHGMDFLIGYGSDKLELDILADTIFPETSFIGGICGSYNELAELCALARRKALKLSTTTFDLTQVNQVLGLLRTGKMVDRGLLVPNKAA